MTLNMCREDNNRLVPMMLDRLQTVYSQFCEEISQNTKPFSNLNNDVVNNEKNLAKSSPRKKSNVTLY